MQKIKDELITLLIEHSRIIHSVVSDMGVYYSGWSEDYAANKDNLEKKKGKMQLSEEEGDTIKIRLITEFSEAGSQGLGDYITLVLKMDNVINSALEFVDMLSFIDDKISDEIKKRYHNLINSLIKMSAELKKTIKNLRDKTEDVFNNTTTIHEIENDVDKIYREFLNYLHKDKDLDIRVLLLIRDSIFSLEALGDKIHDVADLIRVLNYQ
jgi:uncharacterized protein Yka (UPF0111/DUF47 family)